MNYMLGPKKHAHNQTREIFFGSLNLEFRFRADAESSASIFGAQKLCWRARSASSKYLCVGGCSKNVTENEIICSS